MRLIASTSDIEYAISKFNSSGFKTHPSTVNIENRCEIALTPTFEILPGVFVFAVNARDCMSNNIPENDENFNILWRSDMSQNEEPTWEMSYDPPIYQIDLDGNGSPLPGFEVKYIYQCPSFGE